MAVCTFTTGRTRSPACARWRVARRVVVFLFDTSDPDQFWLTRDCLPEFAALRSCIVLVSLTELAGAIDARTEPVPIPWDCADGFFEAHWRRPEAYLDENVRRGVSVWDAVGPDDERRACTASATTSPQDGGPTATATSSGSTQQSSALAC